MTEKTAVEQALWVAHALFDRGKVAGAAANLSFYVEDKLYITSGGTCFGTLTEDDFSVLDASGSLMRGGVPSKELPLHRILYEKDAELRAVLHTHSFYTVMWSMESVPDETDCVPPHTPYLRMRLGTVGLVDDEQPGTPALFDAFRRVVAHSDGFILRSHGPVVGGRDIMDAFCRLEELEESCKVAWYCKYGRMHPPYGHASAMHEVFAAKNRQGGSCRS